MEIRIVKEIVSRRFYKYFEKKKSERMPMRKIQDYTINLREGFVPKKREIFFVKNRGRKDSGIFERSAEKEIYLTIKITTDITNILCAEEEWEEEDSTELQIFEQLDNQEQLSIATDFRFNRLYREKEDIHKDKSQVEI